VPSISIEEASGSHGIVKHIEDPTNKILLNFYENTSPIVSDKLKVALKPYIPEVIGIPVHLAHITLKFGAIYWILNLEPVSCKTGGSKMCFESDDIKEKKLFKVKLGLRNYVIVDFDIAELILRNSITDILFEEVIVATIEGSLINA